MYTPHVPAIVLLLALALDLALGDPPNRFHPVVLMGHYVKAATRLAPKRGHAARFLYGAALVMGGMLLFSLPLAWALETLAKVCHQLSGQRYLCWSGVTRPGLFATFARVDVPLAHVLLSAVLLKATFAWRGLARAARQVRAALVAGDLPAARRLLSWHLVSRDTARLDEGLIVAATVESIAENITDGLVAPLLAFALGGVPGAWAYRLANTCDSLLGYRDAEREWLGKFAARLDDALNWLPARLTAALLAVGAALAGESGRGAWRTALAQHSRTASPNAGWTMSAMAGALGVTLEKAGHYRLEGGDGALDTRTIDRALRVAGMTVGLFAGLLLAALAVCG